MRDPRPDDWLLWTAAAEGAWLTSRLGACSRLRKASLSSSSHGRHYIYALLPASPPPDLRPPSPSSVPTPPAALSAVHAGLPAMGYLGFLFFASSSKRVSTHVASRALCHQRVPPNVLCADITSQSTTHDVQPDLTTLYPPKKPIARLQPKAPSVPMPMEIVMTILESAYEGEDVPAYNALLKNTSLVCKNWSSVAQKLLFRNVTLTNQTAAIAFQQAVDRANPRGCYLGDAVVRMKVVLDQKQRYRLSHKSFARAVSLCPNLYELSVSLYGEGAPGLDIIGSPDASRMKRSAPSFDERTLDILRAGPQISALQFCNWSDNSSSLLQLLDVWPSLTSLDISGTTPQLERDNAEPFPCVLRELRTNFQSSPSMEFMRWLLHNSVGSLKVLDLAREPHPDMLEYFISEHGATLESLSLPTCGTHEAAAAVRRCAALRELKIEGAWASPRVYQTLPAGLQHLAFSVDSDTALLPVIQAIKRSTDVRVVTMHVWHGGEKHPQLSAVRIACTIKGIELRQTNDVPAFRAITVRPLTFFPAKVALTLHPEYSAVIRCPHPPIPALGRSTTSSTWLHALPRPSNRLTSAPSKIRPPSRARRVLIPTLYPHVPCCS